MYERDIYVANSKIAGQAWHRLTSQAKPVDHLICVRRPPSLSRLLWLLGKLRKRVLYVQGITRSIIKGDERSNGFRHAAR